MTKIIDEDVIRQKPVSDAYRDGWERTFGRPTVYYAHPIWFYNTDRERADVTIIKQIGNVLSPNAPEHETAYQARKASGGKGMGYFLEDVLPTCSACAFRADTDGKISSGVALEVQWFFEHGRPVYEVLDDGIVCVKASDLDGRVLSIEDTKARC